MLKLTDKKIFTSMFCTKRFCLSGPIEAVVHAVRIHCRALYVLIILLSLSCTCNFRKIELFSVQIYTYSMFTLHIDHCCSVQILQYSSGLHRPLLQFVWLLVFHISVFAFKKIFISFRKLIFFMFYIYLSNKQKE